LTSSNEVITLNVGGVLYTTTRSTLTQFGESMLGAMFSGRYRVTALDRDGNPFVDRDGPTFRHVLNFMRTGRLTLPGDFKDYEMLEDEADFYQIEALAEAVRYARVPPPTADEHAKAKPVATQPGSMLEMYQVKCDYEPQMAGGHVTLCGPRWVLLSLPLGETAMRQLNTSRTDYQMLLVDEKSKMELIDHLQTAGWQLVTSSFNTSFSPVIDKYDHARCYTTHKYVWILPPKEVKSE